MDIAFFLGCIAPLRYPGIEASTRAVMAQLNVTLHDLKGASCCPAPGLFEKLHRESWLALAARNLCLAEEMGYDIITICNGCQLTLGKANNLLKEDAQLKEKVNKILADSGMQFKGKIEVKHIIDVIYEDIGLEKVKEKVKRPLSRLKIAPFYGCHYLSTHNGKTGYLEKIIDATGASNIEYESEQWCCGAGEGLRSAASDLSMYISLEKVKSPLLQKANYIVNICPFCHMQLDQAETVMRTCFEGKYAKPTLNIAQLLGLAFGIKPSSMNVKIRSQKSLT